MLSLISIEFVGHGVSSQQQNSGSDNGKLTLRDTKDFIIKLIRVVNDGHLASTFIQRRHFLSEMLEIRAPSRKSVVKDSMYS